MVCGCIPRTVVVFHYFVSVAKAGVGECGQVQADERKYT